MGLKTTIVTILALMANAASAQDWESLNEENVPLKVIAKHYGSNEGVEITIWSQIKENDEQIFLAEFQKEGVSKKVKYSALGRPLSEAVISRDAPERLGLYLDQQYMKPKVVEFREINNLLTKEKSYQVVLKTKNLGEFMLQFDDQLTPKGVAQGIAGF